MKSLIFLLAASQSQVLASTSSNILDLGADFDAIPDDLSSNTLRYNTLALQTALDSLKPNETLQIMQNYHLYPGVTGTNLEDVVIQIDGSLRFERDFSESSNKNGSMTRPCLLLKQGKNIKLTSSNPERGLIHGGGPQWWGIPGIGYLLLQEKRPRLFLADRTVGLLIENLIFQDAPFHSIYLSSINRR